MKIVIVKYNSGNVQSVRFALRRLGVEAIVTDNPLEITSADKIIFPGVGEASSAMQYLKEKRLDEVIVSLRQPVLGICLGMQLLCKRSEEGSVNCLGVFDADVKLFRSEQLKIPEMGWNTVHDLKGPLYKGIKENEYMYFVHSYYVPTNVHTISKTDYGVQFSSALQKDNFYAVQFHPEKSGLMGQQLIENFIKL